MKPLFTLLDQFIVGWIYSFMPNYFNGYFFFFKEPSQLILIGPGSRV